MARCEIFWLGVGGCEKFLLGVKIFLAGCGWVCKILAGCENFSWVWKILVGCEKFGWVWVGVKILAGCEKFWLGAGGCEKI